MSERPPELPQPESPRPAAPQDAESAKPTDPAALKQFIKDARAEAKRGGDVNVANIGEGAQVDQIAVGRNILQAKINIGTFVLPVRVLLVLLVVALVAAVAVWWLVTPGQMPAGNANVAIVEFGAQDANGNISSSAQGAYLSQWMYNRLGDSLSDLPANARPAFWHIATGFDLAHLFQKRTISTPILTPADAEKVAQAFNARIVIYGNLKANQDPTTFTPQFYVSQTQGEADELSGSQQLGQPIPITANVNDEYLEQTLQPLGRALVWFSRGLNNDLNGRYDLAYQVLKQGEASLTDWDANQGKEVLYYFIGREALFMANCEADASIVFTPSGGNSAVSFALDEANKNFQLAQDIAMRNGRAYARATFGLGQVAFQRAQRLLIPPGSTNVGQCRMNVAATTQTSCPTPSTPNTDPATLQQAHQGITHAITLLDQSLAELSAPPPPRLESKIRQVRATADIFLGQLQILERKPTAAGSFMQQAIQQLQPLTLSTAPDDRRTLTNVYFSLGTAQYFSAYALAAGGDTPAGKTQAASAVDSFDACVKLIPPDELDVYLRANQRPKCSCWVADARKLLEELK